MKSLKLFVAVLAFIFAGGVYAAVNINNADATALSSLNGVGDAKAAAIVEYREANGPFASVDDLSEVPGIGAATVDKNRDNMTVKEAKKDAKK